MRLELENLPQPNWFWHGEQVLGLLDEHRPVVCVELGSNRGCSAIATARVIRGWGGRIACVDTWETECHGASVTMSEFMKNVAEAGVADCVTGVQSRIDDAARAWAAPIDYLYVDADHTFDSVTSDLDSWWPYLKVGGLIAGDDYDDPNDTEVPPNVTRAWDTFEALHGQQFNRTVTPGLVSRLIWGVKR